jgi:hypothetical protein
MTQLGGNKTLHLHATCGEDCGWENDTSEFPATDNVVSQHIISKFTDQLYTHILDEGHEVIVSGERK